jgi:Protein of unknown function (DUF3277)
VGVGATYSFKSLTGVMTNTVFGITIPLTGGNIGAGQFSIRMLTERTVHDVASDGTVMTSYAAGDNADLDIEVQESSLLHQELLALYNLCLLAANNDDVSGWAATAISFRMLTDGSQHLMTGVSFKKFPDKPYAAHGQKITWGLMAANAVNL